MRGTESLGLAGQGQFPVPWSRRPAVAQLGSSTESTIPLPHWGDRWWQPLHPAHSFEVDVAEILEGIAAGTLMVLEMALSMKGWRRPARQVI